MLRAGVASQRFGLGRATISVVLQLSLDSNFRVDSLRTYGNGTFLLDACSPGLGGAGKVFDWNLVYGANAFGSIIVAGGLTVENVPEVINTLHPFGVDVASGVESRPGKKDYEKMRRFIEAVQRTDVALMGTP